MKPTKRSYKDLLKIAGLEIPLKQLAAPRKKWMKGSQKENRGDDMGKAVEYGEKFEDFSTKKHASGRTKWMTRHHHLGSNLAGSTAMGSHKSLRVTSNLLEDLDVVVQYYYWLCHYIYIPYISLSILIRWFTSTFVDLFSRYVDVSFLLGVYGKIRIPKRLFSPLFVKILQILKGIFIQTGWNHT